MTDYIFEAPPEVIELCDEIAERMVLFFGIPRNEAVARINCHWRGIRFRDHNDLVLHGTAEHWASRIYYEEEEFVNGQLVKPVREKPPPGSGCWPS